MFGFVTFVYPETVKLILAKGNPHFVCDARVLVKPYKEKGKVPDKYRKQLQPERFDFSGCNSPTGLDSRDPFDLQQLANARMLYNGNNQEMLLRRKLEEQQAAAELQQAIEMQGRRFMGLQLLDIKNRSLGSPTAPILSPLATPNSTTFSNGVFSDNGRSSSNGSQDEALLPAEDKSLSLSSVSGTEKLQTVVNTEEHASANEPTPNEDISYQESAEHNLPDSPFASPTKSSFVNDAFSLSNEESSLINSGIASTLLPPSSPLENMASFKSCFFQIPRFSSGHGAVGL
ncbi:uncharacterized protein A4U43_C07F8090 [Asparagus officinalis]|uniref:RRM domain-containing protein n=1 Tax=Asparagus officinalis TaxID=4686 RepID=A0A5P1EAK3_ASPOF|nr:zinc finger CCCH domain-containing protein 53-like [Asparagus officinalis]ONK62783.1 uncharacterized protein A4U43_C07F8090 [Asparagus officinalis]